MGSGLARVYCIHNCVLPQELLLLQAVLMNLCIHKATPNASKVSNINIGVSTLKGAT